MQQFHQEHLLGIHEAVELRDGDKKRFMGKGVLKAVENVKHPPPINNELKGYHIADQNLTDSILIEMDGTEKTNPTWVPMQCLLYL